MPALGLKLARAVWYCSKVGGGNGDPLQFDLSGYDYNVVYDSARKLKSEIDKDNELTNVDVKLINNVPQLKIKIDHELAAKLGVSPRDVIEAVNYVTNGRIIGSFNDQSDPTRYPIVMKTRSSCRWGVSWSSGGW